MAYTSVLLLLICCLAIKYAYLSRRFINRVRSKDIDKFPEWSPYLLPGLGDAFQLLFNPYNFIMSLKVPLRLRIPTADPFIIVGANNIRKMFKATPSVNPAKVQDFVVKDLFGTPPRASATFISDPSGRGSVPRPGTNVEPRNRVCYLDHDIIQGMLQGDEATQILQKLTDCIYKRINSLDIGDEWQENPDLYHFFTSNISPAVLETFFGPLLTEVVDPNFVSTFWQFDSWVAWMAKRVAPRWLLPEGFRARERCIHSLMRWRQYTSDIAASGGETGATAGIMRKLEFLKADDWDMEAIASTDLGFIASFSSNPIPTMFWLSHELNRSDSLLEEVRQEIDACLIPRASPTDSIRFDIAALRAQPLLQSSISETLRLRTHVFVLRYPDEYDMPVNEWLVPKKNLVMACSTTSHMDPSLWNTGRSESRPLNSFWAERFLESPREDFAEVKASRKFSMRGLEGIWLPFGGGSQMCPGQQFTKTAISLVTALMVTKFDIELCHPQKTVPVSWSHFGAGVIRPGAKVPFRIRKRKYAL